MRTPGAGSLEAGPSNVAGPPDIEDPILRWLVPLLVCPSCRGPLILQEDGRDPAQGILVHEEGPCGETYPVIDGIPRLLLPPHRSGLVRAMSSWFDGSPARAEVGRRWSAGADARDAVVAGFDFEWSRFRRTATPDARAVFTMYFDLVPAQDLSPGTVVLDAGCGAGRWAIEVADRGPHVIALDLGASVDVARVNAGGSDRIACVQADLHDLPIAQGAVDLAYSLGVLHHLPDPDKALTNVAHAVRTGGRVLVYVYYALDQRGPVFRLLFAIVDAVRRITSRLPRPLVLFISTAIGVFVYWPLARLSGLLARLGSPGADAIPLSFYRDRSLATMLNDSLDRFGTTVERRYTRAGFQRLLADAGLAQIVVSPLAPYWHGVGVRAAG